MPPCSNLRSFGSKRTVLNKFLRHFWTFRRLGYCVPLVRIGTLLCALLWCAQWEIWIHYQDFVKATAEHRYFLSGLSHHQCSVFKSTVSREMIRLRMLNERHEGYQWALIRLRKIHITNYKSLAHRRVATTEAGSFVTCGLFCTVWQFRSPSNIDGELHWKTIMQIFSALVETKLLQLRDIQYCMWQLAPFTSIIYGQRVNKFPIRCNAHSSIWNSFDVIANSDKAAMLKHF